MKKNINILNYDNYWNDYLEGQLSESLEQELFLFLDDNPVLYDKLVDDDNLKLDTPEISFDNKESLYAENQVDNLLIAKLEGVISEENDKLITEKINTDKAIQKDYELYKKTRLYADTNIKFPNKSKLKKQITIPLFARITSIAAILFVVYVAGSYVFHSSETLQIEKVQFSEMSLQTRMPVLENTNNIISEAEYESEKIKKTNIVKTHSNNQYSDAGYELVEMQRLPVHQASIIQLNFDINSFNMKSRDNIASNDSHSDILEFTVEYTAAEKENRLRSSLNQILETGREINISESIQNLREKRNELLFTSLNN